MPDAPSRPVATRWRPAALSWVIAVVAIIGTVVLVYPSTASWLSQAEQSKLIRQHDASTVAKPASDAERQLALAERYNAALDTGVQLDAGANVPRGTGTSSDTGLDYRKMLAAGDGGLMARLMIPGIGVDLPVYHGTDDPTLLQGAGHLEGSHLPVGGQGTRSVLTAHRGLASAEMFTNLDRVERGDLFTIETFGRVLTYQVREIRIVDPGDSSSLRAVEGKDLVTLVTCTPLGINTQRILVTGERVTPTPPSELARAAHAPTVPGFPWWALWLGAGVVASAGFIGWAGFSDPRPTRTGPRTRRTARRERTAEASGHAERTE